MSLDSATAVRAVSFEGIGNKMNLRRASHLLFVWPLIAMGGKLVMRVLLNLWDMIEP